MKFTGIAALFAAMTTVTAAPLVNADVAGAKIGLRDAEIQAGMYFNSPVPSHGSRQLLIIYQAPTVSTLTPSVKTSSPSLALTGFWASVALTSPTSLLTSPPSSRS